MNSKYADLIEKSISDLWSLAVQYAPKLFLALLTLFIGLWLIKRLHKANLSSIIIYGSEGWEMPLP